MLFMQLYLLFLCSDDTNFKGVALIDSNLHLRIFCALKCYVIITYMNTYMCTHRLYMHACLLHLCVCVCASSSISVNPKNLWNGVL